MFKKEDLQQFIDIIDASDNIVFFGGAGVSTESGIPDFRSKDGLYNQHDVRFDTYQPEYLLSHTCLMREPDVFFEFYRQKMDSRPFSPNVAHRVLAKLENLGRLRAIVTQNIDGLHQAAGSKKVYEIHGTTHRNYCASCGRGVDENFIFETSGIPKCPSCGGMIRPDVTLYEEGLPEDAVFGAVEAIRAAETLIIAGTSLNVYPAASYVHEFHGKHRIIMNLEPLGVGLRPEVDLFLQGPMGEAFAAMEEHLSS